MSVEVKICGVRDMKSAETAVEAGADFLGFIFVSTSKRYIRPHDAEIIVNSVRGKVKTVGVFQNAGVEDVNGISGDLGLDYAQLHGLESVSFCRKVSKKVIKAFTLPSIFTVESIIREMSQYDADLYLLDRNEQGKGELLDQGRARCAAERFPVFYAGGLTPENVGGVVERVRPFGVDVSGGVETEGRADAEKIRAFIRNAKGVVYERH